MARYKKGDYKVKCDRTGAIVNASDCRLEWNGLFVLKSVWEPRHSQDFGKPARDRLTPQIPRPEGTLSFIDSTDVIAGDL